MPISKSLSASNSKRWLSCHPSALLERGEPFETKEENDYMVEGTLAHEMAEIKLRYANGETTLIKYRTDIKRVKAHKFYTSEINKYTDEYVDVVMEELNASRAKYGRAELLIEVEVNTGDYVPESNWIVDALIVCNGVYKIIDLKYGKGKLVKAEDNTQLKLYALATSFTYGLEWDCHGFEMSIYQPRIGRDVFRTTEMSYDAIFNWGEVVVRHAAAIAQSGGGTLTSGTHCQQCRVAHKCPALDKKATDAQKEDFDGAADFLSDEEILERYHKLAVVNIWAKAVKKHVFETALNNDKKWQGLKMISSTSKRKIVNTEAVEQALEEMGFAEMEYMNTALKGIGDLSNLMDVDTFESQIEPHIEKAKGGPKLVRDNVEGDLWSEQVIDDFKDIP